MNMPYQLPITPHDMGRFDWDPSKRLLTAEASDLESFQIERLFNDACDEGIAILSNKTGRVVYFVLTTVDRTPDSEDIAGWNFTSIGLVRPIRVLVIND